MITSGSVHIGRALMNTGSTQNLSSMKVKDRVLKWDFAFDAAWIRSSFDWPNTTSVMFAWTLGSPLSKSSKRMS
ncbi:hypothetical protein D9M70_650190 [compost metagenome]